MLPMGRHTHRVPLPSAMRRASALFGTRDAGRHRAQPGAGSAGEKRAVFSRPARTRVGSGGHHRRERRDQLHQPSVRQLGGYEADELLGKNYIELTHPETYRPPLPDTPRSFATQRAAQDRIPLPQKDGTWTMLESVARNALADPLVNGIVINSRDVTERRRADDAIRKSEAR